MKVLAFITKYFYRKKVIGIIQDKKGYFLIDQLVGYGSNDWNFSGGGVEKGETEEDALLRELREELGTNKFEILKKGKDTSTYNWPLRVVLKNISKYKRLLLGQSVRYFLVEFTGMRSDIKPETNEIRRIKWIKRREFGKYLHFTNQLETIENELKQFK